MCGIFGLIRNTNAPHPERASAVFVELGNLSIERGKDSAGFALSNFTGTQGPATGATFLHANSRETVIDGIHIIKDTCSFDDLWADDLHLPLLAANRVALGHTRWATQGKRDALTNASPMIVGSLVGSHNGDIDTATVTGKYLLPPRVGTTDTETLYLALNRDRKDRRKVTETLKGVEGRAALAWLDRTKPDRVYLARAALSPLSIAWDAEGNMYWASNPRWFRDIDTMFNGAIGFRDITLVEEGSLLTISVAGDTAEVEDLRRFTPKCRPSDARLSDGVVWRGFDKDDCEADKAQKRHRVAPRVSGWKKDTDWSYGGSKTKTRKTGGGFTSWDMSKPGYAADTAAEPKALLPAYDDRLDAVAADTVKYPTAASLWDADNDADIDGHGENIYPQDDLILDEEEAMHAANRWVDDGADDSIFGVLRSASMPSEIESLMEEFDLSTPTAFRRFRDIVQSWQMEESV